MPQVLAFLYLTAHTVIAYCDDLQSLMSANSQDLPRSNARRRTEAPSMTIDCPAEGHQPQHHSPRNTTSSTRCPGSPLCARRSRTLHIPAGSGLSMDPAPTTCPSATIHGIRCAAPATSASTRSTATTTTMPPTTAARMPSHACLDA